MLWGQEFAAIVNAPVLTENEVHVWRVSSNADCAGRVASFLSFDERDRAARFVRHQDRIQFIASRGALRAILAPYAGFAPDVLQFIVSAYGKPALNCGHTRLNFNLARRDAYSLVAVTKLSSVGVDIERVTSRECVAEVVPWLAPSEAAFLAGIEPQIRSLAFSRCWTRKEAYLKGLGTGLATPLHCFGVSASPARSQCGIRCPDPHLISLSRWLITDLDAAPGYVGAVAVPTSDFRLRFLQF